MMRSGGAKRLVLGKHSEDPHHDIPTYRLMQRWAGCVARVERDRLATPLTDPLWCFARNTVISSDSIRTDWKTYWKSIGRRYDGVVREWMLRKSIHKATAPTVASTALAEAHARLCAPGDHRRVPVELWKAFERAFGPDRAIKPKFFLRAFVDEISDPLARATIQGVAYRYGEAPMGDTAQRRARFDAGCAALHQVLRRHSIALSACTDGALTLDQLSIAVDEPGAFYERLMLL